MLAEYDRVHPGLAERIVTMAELQQRHRMNLETQHNSSEIAQSSRGQWFAFLLSLFNMITGIIFLYKGAPTQGATIITGTLVALAGVFLTGKYLQKKELEAKARIQSGQTPPKDSKKIQK